MIFDKGAKTIQWGEDSLCNKWCWLQWIFMCKRIKLDPSPYTVTKLNSNWIKGKTIKLWKENTGGKLYDTGFGNDFLNLSLNHDGNKRKLNELTIKIKTSMHQRALSDTPEEVFVYHKYDKGLIFTVCKRLLQFKTKKPPNNPI